MALSSLIQLATYLADRDIKGSEDLAGLLEHMADLSNEVCYVWKINVDSLEILVFEAQDYLRLHRNVPFEDYLSERGISPVRMLAQQVRRNMGCMGELTEIGEGFLDPEQQRALEIGKKDALEMANGVVECARLLSHHREHIREEFETALNDLSDLNAPILIANLSKVDIPSMRKEHEEMQRQSSKIQALSRFFRLHIRR